MRGSVVGVDSPARGSCSDEAPASTVSVTGSGGGSSPILTGRSAARGIGTAWQHARRGGIPDGGVVPSQGRYEELVGQDRVVPYVFPKEGMLVHEGGYELARLGVDTVAVLTGFRPGRILSGAAAHPAGSALSSRLGRWVGSDAGL
jgi:hypothetical protein